MKQSLIVGVLVFVLGAALHAQVDEQWQRLLDDENEALCSADLPRALQLLRAARQSTDRLSYPAEARAFAGARIAELEYLMGDRQRALSSAKSSIQMYDRAVGRDEIFFADTLALAAALFFRSNARGDGLTCMLRAQRASTPDDWRTHVIRSHANATLWCVSPSADGEQAARNLVSLDKGAYPDSQLLATDYFMLACSLQDHGRLSEASSFYENAAALGSKLPPSSVSIASLAVLAESRWQSIRRQEAITLVEEAILQAEALPMLRGGELAASLRSRRDFYRTHSGH